MYLLIIFLPVFSLIIGLFFSFFFGKNGIGFILTFSMLLTTIISFLIFYEIILCNSNCILFIFKWFDVGFFSCNWSFYFDGLTSIMCLMITSVSFCVHLFSINYMSSDFQKEKFMSLLTIFTLFMLFLVTADNLIQLLFGWEGVGICSYLLINFWYMRKNTNDSAIKALMFNRLGDFCFFLSIFVIIFYFKSTDLHLILDNWVFFKNILIFGYFNVLDLICFLLVIASMAKSAQLFLTGWLMDAMEGPTPVSALIHAATMVTAGIYLTVRFSSFLVQSHFALFIIVLSGSLTTFVCSLIGIDSFDLKKIIASSTASQLGYMFFICGLMEFSTAITHLFYHAFFKALLFLSAGLIIHSLSDEQDIRKMGGLVLKLPFAFISVLLGSFALIGFPFIGGFYSKDPIIEYSDLLIFIENLMTVFLCTLGAFNTTYYSVKLLNMVFLDNFKGSKIIYNKIHNSSFFLVFPLIFLLFCVFLSFFTVDIFLNEANIFWFFEQDNLFSFREGEQDVDTFIFVFFFIFLGFFSFKNENFFNFNFFLNNSFEFFYFFKNLNFFKWFFDFFINKKIYNNFVVFSNFLFLNFDRGIFEIFGISFFIKFSNKISIFFCQLQSGFIYHYILIQLFGIFFFFFFFHFNFYVLFLSFLFFCFFFSIKKNNRYIFVNNNLNKNSRKLKIINVRNYSSLKKVDYNNLIFFLVVLEFPFILLKRLLSLIIFFFFSFININIIIGDVFIKFFIFKPSKFFFNIFCLLINYKFIFYFFIFLFFLQYSSYYDFKVYLLYFNKFLSLTHPSNSYDFLFINQIFSKLFDNNLTINKNFPQLFEIKQFNIDNFNSEYVDYLKYHLFCSNNLKLWFVLKNYNEFFSLSNNSFLNNNKNTIFFKFNFFFDYNFYNFFKLIDNNSVNFNSNKLIYDQEFLFFINKNKYTIPYKNFGFLLFSKKENTEILPNIQSNNLPFGFNNSKWHLSIAKDKLYFKWQHRDGFKNVIKNFLYKETSNVFWIKRRRFSRYWFTEKQIFNSLKNDGIINFFLKIDRWVTAELVLQAVFEDNGYGDEGDGSPPPRDEARRRSPLSDTEIVNEISK